MRNMLAASMLCFMLPVLILDLVLISLFQFHRLIVSCQEVEIFGNVQADSLYGFTIKDLKIPTYYLFMQRL